MEDNKLKFYVHTEGNVKDKVTEDFGVADFKGIVNRKPIRFPADLGEEHPFDFSIGEGLYLKFGFVNGVIEKIVEYIWGSGFSVRSENKNAEEVIIQWVQEVQFPSIGRKWTREGLAKGNGYIELGGSADNGINGLKILEAKSIYINRDEKGKTINYNQLVKGFNRERDLKSFPLKKDEDYIEFDKENIVHLPINTIGDCAYGYGIIYSNLDVIDAFLGARKDMHMLLSRKANSPYVVTMGSLEKDIFPSPSDVTGMGQKLEWLHNKHEWVVGPDIKMEALQFGAISDKFQFPLENDIDLMFFGFQAPESVMGRAENSGLGSDVASSHGDSWERHINAYREEIEKIVEEQIFKRVLLANGFSDDDHVEIVWDSPSEEVKVQRIQILQGLLSSVSSMELRFEIEKDIAKQLGYDEKIVTKPEPETEPAKDEEPRAGPQGIASRIKSLFIKTKVRRYESIKLSDDFNKDYPIVEWLGFNYRKFVKDITNMIDSDNFTDLKALNAEELSVGYLSAEKILKLKSALKETFTKGLSVKTLSSTLIRDNVIGDLYNIEDGSKVLVLDKSTRSMMVARTETTRMSAKGALENYKNNDIEKVRFIAASSNRTCPICEELNGMVSEIADAPEIPQHVNCRCTYGPVVSA